MSELEAAAAEAAQIAEHLSTSLRKLAAAAGRSAGAPPQAPSQYPDPSQRFPAPTPTYPDPTWMSGTGAPPAPGPARPPARHEGSTAVAPFGRMKGAPLGTIESKDLTWLAGALQTSLGDPSKVQYAAKNQRDLAAVQQELRSRGL